MGIWQWIIVIIWGIRLLCGMILNGEEKRDINGYVQKFSLMQDIAGVAISFIILYFGGFFK